LKLTSISTIAASGSVLASDEAALTSNSSSNLESNLAENLESNLRGSHRRHRRGILVSSRRQRPHPFDVNLAKSSPHPRTLKQLRQTNHDFDRRLVLIFNNLESTHLL
jgi:hypothetical protein